MTSTPPDPTGSSVDPAVTPPGAGAEPAPEVSPQQLSGFRIAVTSDRRSADLIAALERRGAQVIHAPALRIAPIAEDETLIADTRTVIDAAPDTTVVTTAYGMRRWSEAADAAGIGEELTATLAGSRILVRGPKARGAVRAAGLNDDGIAADERTSTLVDTLLESGVEGQTIAVQLHGYADVEQLRRLESGGARVLTVAPYQWVEPPDRERLHRLIEAVCTRNVDLVTFTSAPAVDALFSTAGEMGCADELVAALRTGVVAAAVGPVTAQPLIEVGITPIVPDRYRLGALIRTVCEHLTTHQVSRVDSALGTVEVRGRSVVLGAETVTLAPGPLAIFKALAAARGSVLSRDQLLRAMPGLPGPLGTSGSSGSVSGGEHALDMAMSRLRSSLPDSRLVATVVKRGYRLNV